MSTEFLKIEADIVALKQQAIEAGVREENAGDVAVAMLKQKHQSNQPYSTDDEFPQSFVEWTMGWQTDSHTDKTMVIAGYLWQQGEKSIDKHRLQEMYADARWKEPANLADVLGKAANRGFFVADNGNGDAQNGLKRWTLTRTGYEYFQSLKMED